MNQELLCFSPSKEQYYWTVDGICTKCNKDLSSISFLLWDYYRTNFRQLIYCNKCKNEILKAGGKYQEFKQVMLCQASNLPKDVEAVFPERPHLVSSRGLNIFEVATKNLDGEKIIDNAVACRDPHFMIQSDAKDPLQIKHDLDEIDRRLLPDQADDVLNSLLNADPVEGRFLDWNKDKDEDDDKKMLR